MKLILFNYQSIYPRKFTHACKKGVNPKNCYTYPIRTSKRTLYGCLCSLKNSNCIVYIVLICSLVCRSKGDKVLITLFAFENLKCDFLYKCFLYLPVLLLAKEYLRKFNFDKFEFCLTHVDVEYMFVS